MVRFRYRIYHNSHHVGLVVVHRDMKISCFLLTHPSYLSSPVHTVLNALHHYLSHKLDVVTLETYGETFPPEVGIPFPSVVLNLLGHHLLSPFQPPSVLT